MALQLLESPPTHKVFEFVFCVGQFLGVIPLEYIKNVEQNTMRFRWTSYKTIYSILHIILMACMLFLCIYSAQTSYTGWTFRHLVKTLFYSSSLWIAVSLLLITKRLPQLLEKWIKLDKMMQHNYGYPKNIDKRAKLTTIVTAVYTIGHILVFLLYQIQHTRTIASNRKVQFGHSVFFQNVYPQVFMHLPYSLFLGLLCLFNYAFCLWRMTYADLLISLISSFLSIRFKQLTKRLNLALMENRSVAFWRELREDYDRICVLCKEVDRVVTNVVFASYTVNLVLLLVYLRYCTILQEFNWEKLYNVVCFTVFLTRLVIISLYVSWINDASKDPKFLLNSVSASQYNTEIQRFLQQISFNNVAFTGNKMFKVTRTLILNIGGIILTYELALVQFLEFK